MLSKLQVVSSPIAAQIPQEPLLQVSGVTLQYKTTEYLVTATSQVSFNIHAGDRFVLLGPSGCGKSTLLKAIAGFIKPVEGRISLKNCQIDAPGPDRMMVFQEFDQLLPWKTVRQNIELPLKLNKRADVARSAEEIIERVGLTKFADAHPHTLSGGMKQRVAIARAMAMKPDVLLMDEPYAALDALTRRKMQHELLQLWDKTRFTLIFVTHSIEEAVLIGSRILVLSPHPGRVRAELNAHQFGPDSQNGPEFQALCKKINDMLFEH